MATPLLKGLIMSNENQVLGTKQESYTGDVILQTLEMGSKQGFKHVAKYWLENGCMSFDAGRELIEQEQKKIEDIACGFNAWDVIARENGVFFNHKPTGRDFKPTDHSLDLLCRIGKGLSSWALRAMMAPITGKKQSTGEEYVVKGGERDIRDYQVLADYIRVHVFNNDRVDQSKIRLFRTWTDGTLRAVLSDQYIIVNNRWFLDALAEFIPGGVLSHWNGDADQIYGNVLIPDTIREEKDSDFGGMLSVGNSEIGTRRISSRPSVFRAICMNGCIWNQEEGKALNRIHKGKNINFAELKEAIRKNLEEQIPLLPQGIERVLGIRAFGQGDTPTPNIMAQTAVDFKLSKSQVEAVWKGYATEIGLLGPEEGKTAYGLMNAVTRAGQTLESNSLWVAFDEIGGEIANMSRNDWDSFRNRAEHLTKKQVEKYTGQLVAA